MKLFELDSATCPLCESSANYSLSGRDVLVSNHKRYDYYACDVCGAYFLHPMPDALTVASFYPEDYVCEDAPALLKRVPLLRHAELALHHGYTHLKPSWAWLTIAKLPFSFYRKRPVIDYVRDGVLLDVGCGNGRYLKAMRAMGWKVQGVEFNKKSVEHCHSAALSVHHGDLHSAKFSSASFDVITARHVIEHIPTPQEFMAELARILKPGGMLVVETPNFSSLGWAWFGTRWYASGIPYHLMLFSPGNLQGLAERHGLILKRHNLETTPKLFLNSIDMIAGRQGKPSRKIWWRRVLSRWFVWYAQKTGRGDVIHSVFQRPE